MENTGERYIPGISGQIELEHLNRYYFVINQVDLRDKIVLDLASGEGYGADILAGRSRQVYGVDISIEAIDHAKSRYVKDNLTFLVGEATDIPLPDHSIDIFVSFETIEHHDRHSDMLDEIKRVLKPNGLLIISSPDKYFYSDVPDYKNHFHVKELYYEEFKKLITDNFKFCKFFMQKIFIGSIIAFDGSDLNYRVPVVFRKNGEAKQFVPEYNISIATNDPSFKINNQVVMYSSEDGIIFTQNDLVKVKNDIYNSSTWKAGNFLVKPLKLLRNLFLK